MTREAILKLQTYKLFEDGELLVCRDDVLKALEQKPCEDKITEWKKDFKEYVNALSMPRDDYKGIMEYIDELPATSEPCEDVKTGYWKCYTKSAYHGCDKYGEPIWRDINAYLCSRCKRRTVIKEKYCPNCGAKMKEEVEQ